MQIGLIEGFYGPAWCRAERDELAQRLAAHGYGFWHYAPKADPHVRTGWRSPWPTEQAESMRGFARHCRDRGLRFGVGLSPLGLASDGPHADWRALAARLRELDAIGIDDLVIGFDDQRGERADLAVQQARIAEWVAARTTATRILVCPTYYSDDPLLDALFGARPTDYLAELGAALDARIGVYWAGEEICPREISPGHVERVAETLRRPPWLWDNYPVNDGPRACEHLHLRPFTGRPGSLDGCVVAHAVNPALQPTLSAVPALTLPERYRLGEAFAYMDGFRRAARAVLGAPLAERVTADLGLLEDTGRDRLGDHARVLRATYSAFDHRAAREIVAWLDGHYRPSEAAPSAEEKDR